MLSGLPAEVGAELTDLAAGHPEALNDLAAGLTEEQRRGVDPPPVTLPPGNELGKTFRAYASRLPADTRRLLTLAAADPDLDAAELLAGADRLGLSAGALEPVEAAGLVTVTGPRVVFVPPVLRAVAYHDAPLGQRLAAHAALGAVLAARGPRLRALLHRAAATVAPDEALARELAGAAATGGHLLAATALERAAVLTGEPAFAAAALVDAARHCRLVGRDNRARRLLRRLPAPGTAAVVARAACLSREIWLGEHPGPAARDDVLAAARDLVAYDVGAALDALLLVGEACHLAGEHDRYREVARTALALRHGTEEPLRDLAFSQVAGQVALLDGDFATGFPQLRRVLDLARRVDDPAVLIRAATAGLLVGDGHDATALAARAAARARERGDAALLPAALAAGAFAGLATGDYEAATALALDGAGRARAVGQPGGIHLAILAVLAALVGDRETALLRVRQARPPASAEGPGQVRALCEWALALLDLVAGRPVPVLARLLALTGQPSGHGNVVVQVAATPHLLEAAAGAGRSASLGDVRADFSRWALATDRPAWLALSERCAALATGDEAAADDHFRAALRRHRAGDGDFARAHTQLLYGRQLRRRRRPGEAREHLRDAAETFRLLSADPWAAQAEAELRAAGDRCGPAHPGELTAHQERIARLVAEGATNREVAQQLLVSTRTIEHHLRAIFARLGVRSRTELARMLSQALDASAPASHSAGRPR